MTEPQSLSAVVPEVSYAAASAKKDIAKPCLQKTSWREASIPEIVEPEDWITDAQGIFPDEKLSDKALKMTPEQLTATRQEFWDKATETVAAEGMFLGNDKARRLHWIRESAYMNRLKADLIANDEEDFPEPEYTMVERKYFISGDHQQEGEHGDL